MTQTTRRSDNDIQATVSEELRNTPSVGAHVRVAVSGGVVTLTGEVGSLPERIAATNAATRVSGVKAVADELHIRTPGSSAGYDTDIAQAASQLLSWAVDVPANTVTAEVHNHVITLSGHVTWNYQREAAARAVMYIHGVTAVANNITLARRPVSVLQDAAE